MANQAQLHIAKIDTDYWNDWRKENPDTEIDLSEADLSRCDLSGANLREANLRKANLSWIDLEKSNLWRADLREANLGHARLIKANISEANLSGADLTSAQLYEAFLNGSNLNGANLFGAELFLAELQNTQFIKANFSLANLASTNLTGAMLIEANLFQANLAGSILTDTDLRKADLTETNIVRAKIEGAKISGSKVYGINVWDLAGELAEQNDLIITRDGDPVITVDNIKVAQFLYLILNNNEIRDVLNTITSKSVLILGRFAIPERKTILDALRNKLREHNLLPIVFDFDRPTDKDFTETIKTLASLSYFVIADITNPKSSPLELQATVPDYQIPFVPIIQEGESPFAMMVDLQKKYNWVLNTVSYDSQETLMKALKPLIIDPAMKKRQELRIIKAQEPEIISAKDYLEKGKV